MNVAERVGAHYDRKADRAPGTMWAVWNRRWANMARAGHTNALTRRVARIMAR